MPKLPSPPWHSVVPLRIAHSSPPLPLAEAAGRTYRRSVEEGRADQVFFATLETLERAAEVVVEKL